MNMPRRLIIAPQKTTEDALQILVESLREEETIHGVYREGLTNHFDEDFLPCCAQEFVLPSF